MKKEKPIMCATCKLPKPASEFTSKVKKQGMPIITKSCQGCRDLHGANHSAGRIRDRQQEYITVANELNRLMAWAPPA